MEQSLIARSLLCQCVPARPLDRPPRPPLRSRGAAAALTRRRRGGAALA